MQSPGGMPSLADVPQSVLKPAVLLQDGVAQRAHAGRPSAALDPEWFLGIEADIFGKTLLKRSLPPRRVKNTHF